MSMAHTEVLEQQHEASSTQMFLNKIKAYFTLTKPGIMSLLLFTAYCAAALAAGRIPSASVSVPMLLGLALSAGAAATINMWYDRDIDPVMRRTAHRPIPAGIVTPRAAFTFALIQLALSVVVLAAFVNVLTAVLGVAGFLYYAVVYTMLLKRKTPQNIVVGGGAGAVPVVMGWTAVTNHVSLASLVLFGIILLWTPAHFWSLALFKNGDYVRAGIPMMPVVRGPKVTKRLCVGYTVLLFAVSLALYFTGTVGVVYLVSASVLNAVFLYFTIEMWREADNQFRWAKRTFFGSLLYLPAIFTFMVIGMPHV